MGLSTPAPNWVDVVQTKYETKSELQKLMERFKTGELDPTLYSCHNGMIFYEGQLYIATNSPFRNK